MGLEVLQPERREGPQTGSPGMWLGSLTAPRCWASLSRMPPTPRLWGLLGPQLHWPRGPASPWHLETCVKYVPFLGLFVCICCCLSLPPPPLLRNVWLKNSSLVPAELRGKGLWPTVSWRIAGAGPLRAGVGAAMATVASDQAMPGAEMRDGDPSPGRVGSERQGETGREAGRHSCQGGCQRGQDGKGKCRGRHRTAGGRERTCLET